MFNFTALFSYFKSKAPTRQIDNLAISMIFPAPSNTVNTRGYTVLQLVFLNQFYFMLFHILRAQYPTQFSKEDCVFLVKLKKKPAPINY